MKQDKIVFYITNKTPCGEKKQDYYTSGFLPRGLAKKYPEKVFIVDIDAPENQAHLLGDKKAPLYAFPVDENYRVTNYSQYSKNAAPLNFAKVGFVIPYTSSEANPEMLRHITSSYPENTVFLNNPTSMAKLNSKEALEEVRADADAAKFSAHINPQTLISISKQYEDFIKSYPNTVLRVPRSTEGIGVYIHAPDYLGESEIASGYEVPNSHQHRIENILAMGPVLATPYIDTKENGDTRVYAVYVPHKGVQIIENGIGRFAPTGTKENPCPKCNHSAGGYLKVYPLTAEQKTVVTDAMEYYHDKHGLSVIGFDLLGDTKFPIISEINNSADGWTCVTHQGKTGDEFLVEAVDNFYQFVLQNQGQKNTALDIKAKIPTRQQRQISTFVQLQGVRVMEKK